MSGNHESLHEVETLACAIAYKIGHDEFGLKDNEFAFRLWPAKHGRGWNVQRGRTISRVYFSLSPFDADFESKLRSALASVAWIKRTKMTNVVRWEGLKIPAREIEGVYRELYGLPPQLTKEEIEVEVSYVVKIKHPVTGLFVEEKGPVPEGYRGLMAIQRLVDRGRETLTEKVIEAVRQLQQLEEQKEVHPHDQA